MVVGKVIPRCWNAASHIQYHACKASTTAVTSSRANTRSKLHTAEQSIDDTSLLVGAILCGDFAYDLESYIVNQQCAAAKDVTDFGLIKGRSLR